MAEVSGWTITAAIATPILALVGSAVGAAYARRADNRLDTWRRREETYRMLRWAVELTASDNDQLAGAGFATMRALTESELLQPEDQPLLRALTEETLLPVVAAYSEDETEGGGDDA